MEGVGGSVLGQPQQQDGQNWDTFAVPAPVTRLRLRLRLGSIRVWSALHRVHRSLAQMCRPSLLPVPRALPCPRCMLTCPLTLQPSGTYSHQN